MSRNNQLITISVFVELLFFIPVTSIVCQNLMSPGYIIRNQGDTINGFITLESDRRFSMTCNFCETQDGIFHEYTPYELQGFRLQSGKFYVSREIQTSVDSSRYFLEYLINGKANIYYLRTEKDLYFIEKDKGRMVRLDEEQKTIKTEDGVFLMPPKYKGILLAELSDWKDAPNSIKQSSLSHRSLIDLARRYHENICADSNCIIYERPIKKLKLRFGLAGGTSAFTCLFGENLGTTPAPCFHLGGRMELLHSTYSRNRLTYQFDIQISYLKKATFYATEKSQFSETVYYQGQAYYLVSKDENPPSSFPGYVDNLNVSLNLYTIKSPLKIKYFLTEGRIRPHIGAGFSTAFILGQDDEFDYPFFSSNFSRSFPEFYVGYILETGVNFQLKKGSICFLELTYDFHSNTDINRFYRAHLNSFGLTGGIHF